MTRRIVFMAVATFVAVALLVTLGSRVFADRSSTSVVVPGGHGGNHHQPTKGSRQFQYATPNGGARDATPAYNPEVAPPTSAPNGIRDFELVIEEDVPHEVAPGVTTPTWAFNRTVPGPVLRATEGDLVRVKVINKGKLPHTIHFHGKHQSEMDGVFELIPPGGTYTYQFVAQPFGIMPYHCHTMPTSQHIQNGLYGMLIIDPKQGRKPMRELAMMMSAFDLDRDGEADFYAWNGRAFQYADHPIELKKGEHMRMYVVNMFEESMVPHLHGNMYNYFPSGTTLKPAELTDVKTLNIAERGILEFTYDVPGTFMFQCHVSEHMEQGLMGWFKVSDALETARAR